MLRSRSRFVRLLSQKSQGPGEGNHGKEKAKAEGTSRPHPKRPPTEQETREGGNLTLNSWSETLSVGEEGIRTKNQKRNSRKPKPQGHRVLAKRVYKKSKGQERGSPLKKDRERFLERASVLKCAPRKEKGGARKANEKSCYRLVGGPRKKDQKTSKRGTGRVKIAGRGEEKIKGGPQKSWKTKVCQKTPENPICCKRIREEKVRPK